MNTTQVAQALRDIADFIESRPELILPVEIKLGRFRDQPEVHYQPAGADGMRSFAQHAHIAMKKEVNDAFYNLLFDQPTFTGLAYEYRLNVCERVLVGTEVEPEKVIPAQPERIEPAKIVPKYEYRCPKLLEPVTPPEAEVA